MTYPGVGVTIFRHRVHITRKTPPVGQEKNQYPSLYQFFCVSRRRKREIGVNKGMYRGKCVQTLLL